MILFFFSIWGFLQLLKASAKQISQLCWRNVLVFYLYSLYSVIIIFNFCLNKAKGPNSITGTYIIELQIKDRNFLDKKWTSNAILLPVRKCFGLCTSRIGGPPRHLKTPARADQDKIAYRRKGHISLMKEKNIGLCRCWAGGHRAWAPCAF